MKRIYKFPLEVTDEQTITLSFGAEILTVQAQQETLCLCDGRYQSPQK